jgi:hypothetical protein
MNTTTVVFITGRIVPEPLDQREEREITLFRTPVSNNCFSIGFFIVASSTFHLCEEQDVLTQNQVFKQHIVVDTLIPVESCLATSCRWLFMIHDAKEKEKKEKLQWWVFYIFEWGKICL